MDLRSDRPTRSDVEGNWDSDGAQWDCNLSSIIQVALEGIGDSIINELGLFAISAGAEAFFIWSWGFTTAGTLWAWHSDGWSITICWSNDWARSISGIQKLDSLWCLRRLWCFSLLCWDRFHQLCWISGSWWAVESNNNWAINGETDLGGALVDDIDVLHCFFFFPFGWLSSLGVIVLALFEPGLDCSISSTFFTSWVNPNALVAICFIKSSFTSISIRCACLSLTEVSQCEFITICVFAYNSVTLKEISSSFSLFGAEFNGRKSIFSSFSIAWLSSSKVIISNCLT